MAKLYSVRTDLPPEQVDDIALRVFQLWVDFALGRAEIGGHVLKHPTGRYASSISVRKYGRSHIALIADEDIAPEAQWIEEGHAAVDFKAMFPGKVFRMHEAREGTFTSRRGATWTSRGYGPPVIPRKAKLGIGAHISSVKRQEMWAEAIDQGESGFARVPQRDSPDVDPMDWVIPAMPAYSPAAILAERIEEEARRRGGAR